MNIQAVKNKKQAETAEDNLSRQAQEKKGILDSFYSTVEKAGMIMNFEQLEELTEALKLATISVREREERRRAEELAKEAEKRRQEEEKRRIAAAKRAARRAEKKRQKHVAEVTAMDLPMDFVNVYEQDERTQKHRETPADGLLMSLDALGGLVDIEFISAVCGQDYKTVIEALKGSIYQNPLHWGECFYKGWETADEYLSGNLNHKYQVAVEANKEYDGYFQANVDALEKIMGPQIDVDDIYIALGSPWVPTDIIDEFILHLIGEEPVDGMYPPDISQYLTADYAVRHEETTGEWEIPQKNRFRVSKMRGKYEVLNYSTWGTHRMDMLYLLENTLNQKTLSISDAKDAEGKIRVINREETAKLLEKQQQMIAEFRNWVWKDEARKNRLRRSYCRKYGNIRQRHFDGSFLIFPDMSDDVELYPFQKDSVARIILSPNTLLAHDVGSGKTYTMIAAGMELRRLGKSKKNLYVVPNNIVSQWREIFLMMYPQANLLIVDNRNFNIQKRSATLRRIQEEDFDAIIMAYSCFDMLSLSEKYYKKMHTEHMAMLRKAEKFYYSKAKIEKKLRKIQTTLEKLHEDSVKAICEIPFDALGINTLFVDEAHNYKNVGFDTDSGRVLGSGGRASDKAKGMMDKVHCVQRMNNGGRVIMATGTPVTNSLTDLFVMQKYLQDGELEFLGLQNFDAWAGMFAEKTTDFEIDVDTNSYHLATRFSRFCNVPELTSVLSSIADFHHVDKEAGIPDFDGYDDSLQEGSEDFKEYLKDISNRADDVRQKRVKPTEDNLLKITTDGRKAALDMRLIDAAFGLEPDSKVFRCAENVVQLYEETRDTKGTQLVFCDISTPKQGFNLYDELKSLLAAMGIPKNEIAYVHDADNEQKRLRLFEEMRNGEKSILIGSTFKMGIGVNVQDRLKAIHHLDVPWRPADMVQREGRILRQGNTNEKVQIFRYITKGSFDAYSWQLLEAKQRFISQILSGRVTVREGDDVDEAVLNYAEVKALAVGNPMIKERVRIANDLSRTLILQRDFDEERTRDRHEFKKLPDQIRLQEQKVERIEKDLKELEENPFDYNQLTAEQKQELRRQIFDAVLEWENRADEKYIMDYDGFQVIVPAGMKPYETSAGKDEEGNARRKKVWRIYLKRHGSYFLELESEMGVGTRLSNFCRDHIEKQYDKETKKVTGEKLIPSRLSVLLAEAKEELATMQTRQGLLEEKLKSESTYPAEIARLEKELREIDEQLGVKVS